MAGADSVKLSMVRVKVPVALAGEIGESLKSVFSEGGDNIGLICACAGKPSTEPCF